MPRVTLVPPTQRHVLALRLESFMPGLRLRSLKYDSGTQKRISFLAVSFVPVLGPPGQVGPVGPSTARMLPLPVGAENENSNAWPVGALLSCASIAASRKPTASVVAFDATSADTMSR